MTYEQALEIINSQIRVGKEPALDRIYKLLAKLGNPQDKLRFVHVGGTNGKGTTCTLIASALTESGLKVGLYTSPYVIDFRERFQIGDEMIPKNELTEIVEKIAPIAEEMRTNGDTIGQFEFITAVAFEWFLAQKCDIVVLEVGIGGRFDATNVIQKPEVAVITSISKDHTEMLGDTIPKIAFEKAGIIKPRGEVVLYPLQENEAVGVIETACLERNARLTIPDLSTLQIEKEEIFGTHFIYRNKALFTPFMGKHQVHNAVTAYEALQILKKSGFALTDEQILQGFSKAFIPARMEILARKPLILLDGGHNVGFAKALKEVILQLPKTQKRTAVFGMMKDKDSKAALGILAPLFDKMIMTSAAMPRAQKPDELKREAQVWCKDILAAESQQEALQEAFRDWQNGSAIIICGSFYLAGEVRTTILNHFNKNLEK
ncbi:bifunctional folylpolyglutamate synthase/dihydrofolate synthase [Scatolibacter rhodanostii]|uniref:bifunctional folylpolyglutamate synthase/dihydrofolate synthase n=1 Tax=Scatolibacter rhodanostii TaxID=2014781 RepID=UPI000C07EF2D|nr:folylpolyglutamate synthase/dihydrofolate synthase family protein [Scatolibacter rhodanostii]